jgi:hypothetical protein
MGRIGAYGVERKMGFFQFEVLILFYRKWGLTVVLLVLAKPVLMGSGAGCGN